MSKVKTLSLTDYIELFNAAIVKESQGIAAHTGDFTKQYEHIERICRLGAALELGVLAPTDMLYLMAVKHNLL